MSEYGHVTREDVGLDWWGAWSVALISSFWLSQSALIGLHWHDTSEFIGAGRALAVAHPPGHPLTLISIHLSQLSPWLDATARGHLTSVYWGAIGSAAMYLNAQLIMSVSAMTRGLNRLLCASVALSSVALPMVWLQLTRAEVYGPQWALTCVSWTGLFYATRHRDDRGYLITALALGLLAANHTLLTAALVIGLLPRLTTLHLGKRVWGMSLLASLVGLSLYQYVWARGTHGGVVGWGWINSASSFWEHISARVWQAQVSQRVEEVSWLDNCARFVAFLTQQVGWLVAGFGLIAVTLVGTRRCVEYGSRYIGQRGQAESKHTAPKHTDHQPVDWGVTLAWTTLCVALTKLTYPFSEQNPDFSGYIAASAPSLLLLLGRSVRVIYPQLNLLMFTLILASAVTRQAQSSGARAPESMGAEAWGRMITAEVPTEGALWSSFYATHFITSALWAVEGWRSDITLAFRGHRSLEWAHRRSAPLKLELNTRGARYEPERGIDAAPELWSHLSVPGARGQITSALVSPRATAQELSALPSSLADLRAKWLERTDARVRPPLGAGSSAPLRSVGAICDEDSAYTWALYHEVALRSLYARIEAKRREIDELHAPRRGDDLMTRALYGELRALRESAKSHADARAWWIDVISNERWAHIDDLR